MAQESDPTNNPRTGACRFGESDDRDWGRMSCQWKEVDPAVHGLRVFIRN